MWEWLKSCVPLGSSDRPFWRKAMTPKHVPAIMAALLMLGGSGSLLRAADSAPADLPAWLALPEQSRGQLADLPFAGKPLTREQAAADAQLLIADDARQTNAAMKQQLADKAITWNDLTLKYLTASFGEKPANGHALFISMHGGGNAAPEVNDQQWQNQITLYTAKEGLFVAPRAPTNTWNLWHEPHIDVLFDKLIRALVAAGEVDPDRVYLMGYSAGGDGVYQLAPRMADRFAAAAMMAGHPNDASPLGLRNLPFTIHVGALDSAYNRNDVAKEWGKKLDDLQNADKDGYVHFVKLHEGREHWMNGEDAEAVPWMLKYTRNPLPTRVVWKQSSSTTHDRFYWLAVPAGSAKKNALVSARREDLGGQVITIENAQDVAELLIRLNDQMFDLDKPVTVRWQGRDIFSGLAPRTIATLQQTLAERGDPHAVFSAEIKVKLDTPATAPATAPARTTIAPEAALDDAIAVLAKSLRAGDSQIATPDFLRRQASLALAARDKSAWARDIPIELFNEFVLPCTSVDETIGDWRSNFARRFTPAVENARSAGDAAQILNRTIYDQLKVKYSATLRPQANQSPSESIAAGYASCTGLSILLIDTCRSVGVPARLTGTPQWAIRQGDANGNNAGNHTWVEVWDGTQWRFMGAAEPGEFNQTWFVDNASRADKDHPILAASSIPADTFFPMVWNPADHSIPAIDRTAFYASRVSLRVDVPEGAVAFFRQGGRLVARVTSSCTLYLPASCAIEIELGTERKTLTLTAEKDQHISLGKFP